MPANAERARGVREASRVAGRGSRGSVTFWFTERIATPRVTCENDGMTIWTMFLYSYRNF
jgi:hypothetical protein